MEEVEREAKAIREREEKREGKGENEAVTQPENEEGTDRTDEDQVEERDSGTTRRRDESGILASGRSGKDIGIEIGGGSEVASSTSELDLSRRTDGVRKRRITGDAAGDLSTDSEWDKVSEVEDMDR